MLQGSEHVQSSKFCMKWHNALQVPGMKAQTVKFGRFSPRILPHHSRGHFPFPKRICSIHAVDQQVVNAR